MPRKLPSLKNLSSRQRSFCKRLAAGEEPHAIISELFPHQESGWVLCRMLANKRVAAFVHSVAEIRSSPDALLLAMDRIRNDPKARSADVLGAARLSERLARSTRIDSPSRGCSKFSPGDTTDKELTAKMMELKRKAQIL